MLSLAEENYLKTIYKLQQTLQDTSVGVSTNNIAIQLQTKAGSVSEMLKKLADKSLIHYQPYQGVWLTEAGLTKALQVVRRHRLWETFLVESLGFPWDKVHALAEELEHIRSEELTERLDAFLKHPKFDPHGDPIPNVNGELNHRKHICLNVVQLGQIVVLSGVEDHTPEFLRYLESKHLQIGASIEVLERVSFDGSSMVSVNKAQGFYISQKVAANLLVMV